MKQSAPLSQSQYGIYVECTNHQGEVYYNLPFLFALDPSLDGERLRQAVETTVRNHPTLFTRIEVDAEGEPLQTIDLDKEEWTLQLEEIDSIDAVNARQGTFLSLLRYSPYHQRWLLLELVGLRCESCIRRRNPRRGTDDTDGLGEERSHAATTG